MVVPTYPADRSTRGGASTVLFRTTSVGARTMAWCVWLARAALSSRTSRAPSRPTSCPGCAIVVIGIGLSQAAWLLSYPTTATSRGTEMPAVV